MSPEELKIYQKNYYIENREYLINKSKLWNDKNRKTLSRLQQKQNRIKKILKENERKIKNFKEQTFL
jgi:hypothetical protein